MTTHLEAGRRRQICDAVQPKFPALLPLCADVAVLLRVSRGSWHKGAFRVKLILSPCFVTALPSPSFKWWPAQARGLVQTSALCCTPGALKSLAERSLAELEAALVGLSLRACFQVAPQRPLSSTEQRLLGLLGLRVGSHHGKKGSPGALSPEMTAGDVCAGGRAALQPPSPAHCLLSVCPQALWMHLVTPA